jgi:hypothetical protein
MKIFSLVTDSDAGTFCEIYHTEDERDARCLALCADLWEDGEMPPNWRDAYSYMQNRSADWWFHLSEHDLTAHPAVMEAIATLWVCRERLVMGNYEGQELPFIEDVDTALDMLQ